MWMAGDKGETRKTNDYRLRSKQLATVRDVIIETVVAAAQTYVDVVVVVIVVAGRQALVLSSVL
jgi:hypothetical protein